MQKYSADPLGAPSKIQNQSATILSVSPLPYHICPDSAPEGQFFPKGDGAVQTIVENDVLYRVVAENNKSFIDRRQGTEASYSGKMYPYLNGMSRESELAFGGIATDGYRPGGDGRDAKVAVGIGGTYTIRYDGKYRIGSHELLAVRMPKYLGDNEWEQPPGVKNEHGRYVPIMYAVSMDRRSANEAANQVECELTEFSNYISQEAAHDIGKINVLLKNGLEEVMPDVDLESIAHVEAVAAGRATFSKEDTINVMMNDFYEIYTSFYDSNGSPAYNTFIALYYYLQYNLRQLGDDKVKGQDAASRAVERMGLEINLAGQLARWSTLYSRENDLQSSHTIIGLTLSDANPSEDLDIML